MIQLAPSSPNIMSYDEALLYCQFLTHSEYNDWRLPTRDEYWRHAGLDCCWFEGRNHYDNAAISIVSTPMGSILFDNRAYAIPVRDV
jgi:hypothetical protein